MTRWIGLLLALFTITLARAQDEVRLLIVYPDSLETAVQTYHDYRESQGVTTSLLPISEAGSNPSEYNLCQQLLRTRDTFPFNHLLLVGSLFHIPIHQSDNGTYTDHFYALMDNDSIPSIAVGRLPVNNQRELHAYLTKQQQLSTPNRPPPAGLLIPGQSQADQEAADSAGHWLRAHGYAVHTMVASDGSDKENGLSTAVPAAVVFHIGQGSATAWMDVPQRITSHTVSQLDLPPFHTVISIACSTAGPQFQGNLAQSFVINENEGALAYIGCTGNCLITWADALGLAILRSTAKATTIGQAFLNGKMAYRQRYYARDAFKTNHSLEQLILIGDPSLSTHKMKP